MAELPEIETIRRDLDRDLAGKKIKSAEAASMGVLSRYSTRKSFTNLLDGAKIAGVTRRGLALLINLDEDRTIVITLGESGQLRRNANKDATEPGTELVIALTQGGQLRLVDNEKQADVALVATDELLDEYPELAELGLDPIDTPMSWNIFGELLVSTKAKLKTLLTNSSVVVGIGNVYADEILFNAGLRYDRMSNTLSTQEVRRLYRALVETLHDAIKYRGTTLEAEGYRDVFGEPGEYQQHLQVYGRDGELSPRSRAPIQRAKFGGAWTYFCETQV